MAEFTLAKDAAVNWARPLRVQWNMKRRSESRPLMKSCRECSGTRRRMKEIPRRVNKCSPWGTVFPPSLSLSDIWMWTQIGLHYAASALRTDLIMHKHRHNLQILHQHHSNHTTHVLHKPVKSHRWHTDFFLNISCFLLEAAYTDHKQSNTLN